MLPKDTAYRGYLIVTSPIWGDVYISKDGFKIGPTDSIEKAKKIIDELLD